MKIVILCFILGMSYLIVRVAHKMYKKAAIQDKMDNIEYAEEAAENIVKFNKNHKTYQKDKKIIKDFKKQ